MKWLPLSLILMATLHLQASVVGPYVFTNIKGAASGPIVYQYDSAGRRIAYGQTNGVNQTVTWNLIGKPFEIKTGSGKESFKYSPSGVRYLRKRADGAKTLYFGEAEFHIDVNGDFADRRFLIRNGQYSPIAMLADDGNGNAEYAYYLQDHLGSNLVTVSENGMAGTPESNGRYSPWGQVWGANGVARPANEKHRGFTGHESIASAQLIDMNGRVYDPFTQHFLSADKYLQERSTIVGLNRYAYVANSPLNATDPSGWIAVKINELSKIADGAHRTFVHEQLNTFSRTLSHPDDGFLREITYTYNRERSPNVLRNRAAFDISFKTATNRTIQTGVWEFYPGNFERSMEGLNSHLREALSQHKKTVRFARETIFGEKASPQRIPGTEHIRKELRNARKNAAQEARREGFSTSLARPDNARSRALQLQQELEAETETETTGDVSALQRLRQELDKLRATRNRSDRRL